MPETTTAFLSYATDDWNAPADNAAISYLIGNLTSQVAPMITPHAFTLWQDTHNLRWGHEWDQELVHAVRTAHLFIPLVSRAYLASHWCRKEFSTFLNRENDLGHRRIMPILIRPVDEVDLQELEAEVGHEARTTYTTLRSRQMEVWNDLPSLDDIHRNQLLDRAATGIRDKLRELRQPPPPAVSRTGATAHPAALPINPEHIDEVPIVTGDVEYNAAQGHAVLAELCTDGYFEAEIDGKLVCFCVKMLGLKVEVDGGKIVAPNQKFVSPGVETPEWSALQTGSGRFYKLQIAAKNDALTGHLLVEQGEGTHAHIFNIDPIEGAEVTLSSSVQISLQAIGIQQVDAGPVGCSETTLALQKAVLNILEEKHGGRSIPIGGAV